MKIMVQVVFTMDYFDRTFVLIDFFNLTCKDTTVVLTCDIDSVFTDSDTALFRPSLNKCSCTDNFLFVLFIYLNLQVFYLIND